MKKAIVIGNGPSRKAYDLRVLKGMPTYGCNAIYRSYAPDYEVPSKLFVMDDGMITELEHSDFPSERLVIVPEQMRWEYQEYRPNQMARRNNAGMIAMEYAIVDGYTDIVCLGFDFIIDDKNASTGNVFSGTKNYDVNQASFVDNIFRVNYLDWYSLMYEDKIRFTFLFPFSPRIHPMRSKNLWISNAKNLDEVVESNTPSE